ncbi:MAG TPA: hypothetical protein VLA09_13670, partial [Longimicrobiales bacterium]|nr:hypothetical protein [Longimicrobiales bacterium]
MRAWLPGRLETRTISPYVTEIAAPSSGASPARPQSPAAAPSRTPHPAMVTGISMVIRTGATR